MVVLGSTTLPLQLHYTCKNGPDTGHMGAWVRGTSVDHLAVAASPELFHHGERYGGNAPTHS